MAVATGFVIFSDEILAIGRVKLKRFINMENSSGGLPSGHIRQVHA